MVIKKQPIGNPANPSAWKLFFPAGRERSKFQTKLARLDATDFSRESQKKMKRGLGETTFNKLISVRYDWLFDDLQRFTSVGSETINNKDDLRSFVEETMGESDSFISMKKNNPRRYEASIDKAVNSFWTKGGVKEMATTNVVEVVSPERAVSFSRRIKDRSNRRIDFIRASKNQELFRIRRERFAILRTDKRGRVYFFDPVTGRRVANPQKTLAEVGLQQD